MTTKSASICTWHQQTAERRALKRHGKLGPPDVHPQEVRQEEDVLSHDRLKRGYQIAVSSHEHESLLFNVKGNAYKIDKLDETQAKVSSFLAQVMHKKGEINACLDKERKKNKDVAQLVNQTAITLKVKDRVSFFTDLSRGKALAQLQKRVPCFRLKEDGMEYLFDFRIPPTRAIWFLKMTAALSYAQSKTKKSTNDISSNEYAQAFIRVFRNLASKMCEIYDYTLPCNTVHRERWAYYTLLTRCAFEDGIIDRQEFLNELCEMFSDIFVRGLHGVPNNHAFLRMYILFFSYFIRYINMSLILSRRAAHMLAMKLRLMKMDYEEKHGREISGAEVYEALVACPNNRTSVYVMSALLQCIVMDAPGAVIWNNFRVKQDRLPFILSQLCGSPLDLLPCPVYELPVPPECEKFVEVLKLRHHEISRRSEAVENHWSETHRARVAYSNIIDTCLDVIGFLDMVDILAPRSLIEVTEQIFDAKAISDPEEAFMRIKLMLQWAVSHHREGTYRPVLVAKILKLRVISQGSFNFGPHHLQNIIINYFYTEAPRPKREYYEDEFGALVALFIELCRFRLFDHDWFVKQQLKDGYLDYTNPLMDKYVKKEQPTLNEVPQNPQYEDLTPDEPPFPPAGLILTDAEVKDEHALLATEMPDFDRILIQMPLRQIEEHRSAANQRALVLYGLGEKRENHQNELKKVAKEICRIWQKRIYIQFKMQSNNDDSETWDLDFVRKMTSTKITETLAKFKSQTYYDQIVICGWCAESFSSMIMEFVNGDSLVLPTSEGLDILLSLFETAQYYYGIFEFCDTLVPMLTMAERVIRSLSADCIPGTMSGQLGYVFVSYLSRHWHYFLHCDMAVSITNNLYLLIERMIRARDYPMTSWGRVIAVFVYHAKNQLKASDIHQSESYWRNQTGLPKHTNESRLLGSRSDFRNVFHNGGSGNVNKNYNSLFLKDILEDNTTATIPRFISYHEYKKRLPSFGQLKNRYSFVINAFIAAKNNGCDFDKLGELAAFCGHISAQINTLAEEWIGAIKALCCTGYNHNNGYTELTSEVKVSDCATHYPIATFVMLLGGKYAFSIPRLVAELLNNVFPTLMRGGVPRGNSMKSEQESEPGVCLALQILTKICCCSDEPFSMSEHYVGPDPKVKLFNRCADEQILWMIHWNEMSNVLFPMLSNICILMDTLRGRHKDLELQLNRIASSTHYRKEYLMILLKAVQTVICEQHWVTQKMFQIVESRNMEAFNQERLKQNSLGQQLLRLGLRRRSERAIVQELSVCNGNSKKALIEALLSVMNLWNFRATLFDLTLMIKEISPEGAQKHAQQGAIAADALMGEIGKCCRDLFTNAMKERVHLPGPSIGSEFRFADINKFWLIAPLVSMCPQPNNLPASFQSMTVGEKFVREAAILLDTANDNSKERRRLSNWLLSQQPFVNFLLSCVKRYDYQAHKDGLVPALYRQLQDFAIKTRENPGLSSSSKFATDREGMLLRLSLVGGIFKQICQVQNSEGWSILLFQLMLYGLVDPDRERFMFESCYDMLSTLMLWTLTDPATSSALQPSAEHDTPRYRWPTYSGIIKKLKKELLERRVPGELKEIMQFLPIPKNTMDIIACDQYGTTSPQTSKMSKVLPSHAVGMRHGRVAAQPSTKERVSTYDFIHGYSPDPQSMSKGGWKWSWFQATKLDRLPSPAQKFIAKLVAHKHPMEYARPTVMLMENQADPFLAPPQVEPTNDPVPPPTGPSGLPTSTAAAPTLEREAPTPPLPTPNLTPKDEVPMDDHPMGGVGGPPPLNSTIVGANATLTPKTEPMMMDEQTTPDLNKSTGSSGPSESPSGRGSRGGRKRGTGTRQPAQRQKRTGSRSDNAQQQQQQQQQQQNVMAMQQQQQQVPNQVYHQTPAVSWPSGIQPQQPANTGFPPNMTQQQMQQVPSQQQQQPPPQQQQQQHHFDEANTKSKLTTFLNKRKNAGNSSTANQNQANAAAAAVNAPVGFPGPSSTTPSTIDRSNTAAAYYAQPQETKPTVRGMNDYSNPMGQPMPSAYSGNQSTNIKFEQPSVMQPSGAGYQQDSQMMNVQPNQQQYQQQRGYGREMPEVTGPPQLVRQPPLQAQQSSLPRQASSSSLNDQYQSQGMSQPMNAPPQYMTNQQQMRPGPANQMNMAMEMKPNIGMQQTAAAMQSQYQQGGGMMAGGGGQVQNMMGGGQQPQMMASNMGMGMATAPQYQQQQQQQQYMQNDGRMNAGNYNQSMHGYGPQY